MSRATSTKPVTVTVIHGGLPHQVTREPGGLVVVDGEPVGTAKYIGRMTCVASNLGSPRFSATRRTLEEVTTALAFWWLQRER